MKTAKILIRVRGSVITVGSYCAVSNHFKHMLVFAMPWFQQSQYQQAKNSVCKLNNSSNLPRDNGFSLSRKPLSSNGTNWSETSYDF